MEENIFDLGAHRRQPTCIEEVGLRLKILSFRSNDVNHSHVLLLKRERGEWTKQNADVSIVVKGLTKVKNEHFEDLRNSENLFVFEGLFLSFALDTTGPRFCKYKIRTSGNVYRTTKIAVVHFLTSRQPHAGNKIVNSGGGGKAAKY